MEGTAARSPLLLDGFEPVAPRSVKLEGAAFSLRGRIRVVAATARRAHLLVRAGRVYDVDVALTDGGKVAVACDCVPFSSEGAVCRHIWGALIHIQNEDVLAQPATSAVAR